MLWLENAPAACQVPRRSILELCVADHGNDPTILMRWLGDKTPENVAAWIVRPDHSLLAAVERGTIPAVGSVRPSALAVLRLIAVRT